MCGRYSIVDPEQVLRVLIRIFGASAQFGLEKPRYNVAPRQLNPVVAPDAEGRIQLRAMSWGLVPPWEKAEKPRLAPINARAEDALGKPLFRAGLQRRRCLVPADGYFEWRTDADGRKQPFFFTLKDRRPFFFAGLFEDAAESRPASYATLTTEPNDLAARVHNRMPVILNEEQSRFWLAPGPLTPDAFAALRRPYPSAEMQTWPVSTVVNKPALDVPECIVPVADSGTLPELF